MRAPAEEMIRAATALLVAAQEWNGTDVTEVMALTGIRKALDEADRAFASMSLMTRRGLSRTD